MSQVFSTLQTWFSLITSDKLPDSGENLYWSNGWNVSFWYLANRGWMLMYDPRFSTKREAEALWDPNEVYH